ncbi:MAG TPA: CAP domain-containing protein, partial [Thermoanaerobaculia bacterium]|nr:CAP domain-containing protein [Thermoanaerobaculia bacterium]
MIRRNPRLVLPALAAAMVLAAAAPQSARPPAPAAPRAAKPSPAPRAAAPAAPRDQVLLRINEERTRTGAPPLAPSEALDRMARKRAAAIAAKGALPTEAESLALFNRLQQELIKEGYLAQGWTESVTITAGGAADVISYWKEDPSYREAMRHDYQDVGVGVAEFSGIPLYTFLFAWPKSELYARQTAPLKDLQAVRESMLALVNARRKAEGRPPVNLDPRLNEAAQKHAED